MLVCDFCGDGISSFETTLVILYGTNGRKWLLHPECKELFLYKDVTKEKGVS